MICDVIQRLLLHWIVCLANYNYNYEYSVCVVNKHKLCLYFVWWWWFGFVGQAILFYSFPISSPFPFSSPSVGGWSTKRVTGVARIASANFSHCVMPHSIAVSVVVVTFPSNSFSIIASNSLVLLLLIGDDGGDVCPAGGIMSMKNFEYFVSKLLLAESTSGSARPSDCLTLRRLALSRVRKAGGFW